MTSVSDALAALKAKVADYTAEEETVSLAAGASKAKYIFSSLNKDWDPEDHPRDPNTGEFVKGPVGFIFGKTKSATFALSGKAQKIDLKPGDVAFKTNAGNLVVSHPDGSYTLHKSSGGTAKVPAGNQSLIASQVQNGTFKKVGENPGTNVEAKDEAEAADKIAHPDQYGKTATKAPVTKGGTSAWDIPKPELKAGKTKFTAKQYASYQAATEGLTMFTDSKGQPVKAGGWVDVNGKPYKLYPSPHGEFGLTVYRWVSTKQQASNLEKEDFFKMSDAPDMTVIDDPTGKPYGVAETEAAEAAPKHGALMKATVNAAIPNTATAHKKHVADKFGTLLADAENNMLFDAKGTVLSSGDWVEIDGKPVQVHSSPNEGNVAIAKWVSTKQQASGNTYDFPASVLATAVKIDDPTGKEYKPLDTKAKAAEKIDKALKAKVEKEKPLSDGWTLKETTPEKDAVPDGWVAEFHVKGHEVPYLYEKHNDTWTIAAPDSVKGVVVNDPSFAEKLEGLAYDPASAEAPEAQPSGWGDEDWDSLNAYQKMVYGAQVGQVINLPKGKGSLKKSDNGWYVTDESGWEWSTPATDGEAVKLLQDTDEEVNGPQDVDLLDDPWAITEETKKAVTDAPDPYDEPLAQWEKELLGQPFDVNSVDEEYLADLPSGTMVQGTFGGATLWLHKDTNDQWSVVTGNTTNTEWQIANDQLASSILNAGSDLQVLPAGTSMINDILENPLNHPVQKQVHVDGAEFVWRKDGWYSENGMPQLAGSADALDDAYETKQALKESMQSMTPGDQIHATKKVAAKKTSIYEMQEDGTFKSLSGGSFSQTLDYFLNYLDKSIAEKFNWEVVAADEKKGDATPKQQQFVHPVSGVVFPLEDGDVVYQHKTSEGGFIVVKGSGDNPINFFTTNGKQQKPKAHQKNLEKAYEPIDEWPGKVEVAPAESGSTTAAENVITPGQKPSVSTIKDAAVGDSVFTYKGEDYYSHWIKTANGDWQEFNGDKATISTLSHTDFEWAIGTGDSNPGWNYTFYPNGTSPTSSDAPHTSPWGSGDASGTPQVDPEPYTTAPEPKAKGKKKGKPVLPTEVTLPSGKKVNLKPGEAFGKVKDEWGSSEYYIHITAGPKSGWQNTNHIYNADGTPGYWNKAAKWTPTSMKSWIKKHGYGEVLGENVLVTEKVDFSSYDTVEFDAGEKGYSGGYHKEPGSSALQEQITDYIVSVRGKFPISTYSSGGVYSYQNFDAFPGKNWYDLDNSEKLSLFASYESLAGGGVGSLEPVAKMDLLGTNEKKDYGKARSGLTVIHRAAVLARELNNPDTEWDDDRFDSEIAFIASKVAKPGISLSAWFKHNFPISEFHTLAKSANVQRQFKKTLADLPFDPYNGTTEEYDAYAKSKGMEYLSALTPDQQKVWVLAELKDPSISTGQKQVVDQAIEAAKSKIVVAALAADLQKKQNKSPLSAPVKITKGIHAKVSLKASYDWDTEAGTKVSLKHVGDDEWTAKTVQSGKPDSVLDGLTDSVVSIMVNGALDKGYEVHESSESAYGNVPTASSMQKLLDKHGVTDPNFISSEKLKEILGAEGGGAATGSHATHALMTRWLWFHAAGDSIAKWNIEKQANGGIHPGPNAEQHLGNPNSVVGKAAHKALAEHLWQSPEGQKWLDGEYMTADERVTLNAHLGLSGESVDWAGFNDNFVLWRKYHDQSVLAGFVSGGPATSGGVATQPVNAPDESWALVSSVEAGTDLSSLLPEGVGVSSMTDEELTSTLSASSIVQQSGLSPYIGSLPTHLKRLALWGAGGEISDTYRRGVLHSVAAKAKAGEFMSDTTQAWVSPSGAKFPLSPGASVWKSNGQYWGPETYIVTGPPQADGSAATSGFLFDGNSLPKPISGYQYNYAVSGQYADQVFALPNAVAWDQAKKDNPDLHKTYWDESALIEQGSPTSSYTHHETGALLTAALKNNLVLEADYPHLYALHKHLPENVRQAVLAALEKNNNGKPMLAVMEYKASKGHYASMGSKGLFDANQPWLPFLSKGLVTPPDVNGKWSPEAKSAYTAHFKVPEGSIADHLNSLLNPETPVISKALPAFKDLVLTKTGKSLGGMHTKHVWVDQDGNEWMSKAFDSDPNAKARVDAETGAVRIARLYGFNAPAANTQSVPGYSYAYLQHLAPATGDLTGKGPNDLSLKQLQQAMEEHVLDWIVANHDTHRQNLMLSPDGRVFGIDKGQAFKHFPKDKLAVGYLPPENGEKVWYDNFYNGVISGQVSKETADEVTKHVLRRAQKIAKDQDDEYRAELETALQHRSFWPDQYPSREKFIDGLVERKHNLFSDFVDFYKSVYAKSPYDFDIDTENLVPPKLDDHTHISVSQDYADDVAKASVHGKAMFFASSHMEDSHILMSTAKDQNGQTMLTGEAKILKDGDAVLVDWLQKQTVENQVGYGTSQQAQSYNDYDSTPVDQIDGVTLPGNTEWFAAMVAGSKTVSSHNASGDHQYNAGTLQKMDDAYEQVQSALSALSDWKEDSSTSGKPFKGVIKGGGTFNNLTVELHTMEQQAAWEELLNTYAGYAEKVNAHKNTDKKISPHFTQTTYSPSKTALDIIKAKQSEGKDFSTFQTSQVVEILKGAKNGDQITETVGINTITYTKQYGGWKDESGTTLTSDGLAKRVELLKDSDVSWAYSGPVPELEVEEDSDESSTTVTVGTKVLKVVKRQNAQQNGTYDFDTGLQTLTGGETTSYSGWSLGGHMYEIDFGNTVIEYRPRDPQIPLAQQGLLRFRKKNWDGNADSIDEIFDVLRQVGLDLDPATEASMELHYWKHQYGILRNRQDGKTGKWATLHNKVVEAEKANPNMTVEQELAMFKEVWSEALGSDVVEKADWMPKFSRQRLQAQSAEDQNFTSGHPYWYRSDYTLKDLKEWMGSQVVATSLTYGGNANDALPVALSGSMLSAEERARYYGSLAKSGASTSSDAGKGSSGMVYTKPRVSGSDYEVVYHPRVTMRTSNYAFGYDAYGDVNAQSQSAYWNAQKMVTETTTEMMIKHSASVMDDIIMLKFPSESMREKAIKAYKDRGITTLHGLPIEEIFVTHTGGLSKVRNHVYNEAIKQEEAVNA